MKIHGKGEEALYSGTHSAHHASMSNQLREAPVPYGGHFLYTPCKLFGVALSRKYSSNFACNPEGIASMKNSPISI